MEMKWPPASRFGPDSIKTDYGVANAVRYGTARGEWFLNIVREPDPGRGTADRYEALNVDSGYAQRQGGQDTTARPQVVRWHRHDQALHRRRRHSRHCH